MFNPIDLRNGFERLLQKPGYKQKINRDVNTFLRNKRGLENDPNFIDAMEKLGELIASINWYRNKPAEVFKKQFRERVIPFGSAFLQTEEGRRELLRIVTNAYPFPKRRGTAERKIRNLLVELESQSIREWTNSLYSLSKQGKGTEMLGPKGRDIYLRDMGYLDRVPVDIHQSRFILRTGIYHSCSETLFDPLQKEDMQKAFVRFCDKSLGGLKVCEMSLSTNPGIADLVIWYHSADFPDGFSICGSKPKCLDRKDACEFSTACLFSQVR